MPEPYHESLDPLAVEFRDQLDQFVFFHLGSDALVQIDWNAEGIRVSIEHRRVRPIRFGASRDRIDRLLRSGGFEDFMLAFLVRRRR